MSEEERVKSLNYGVDLKSEKWALSAKRGLTTACGAAVSAQRVESSIIAVNICFYLC